MTDKQAKHTPLQSRIIDPEKCLRQKCEWEETNNGEVWVSECGESFFFDTYGPIENGFRYCPFCGDAITVYKPEAKGE